MYKSTNTKQCSLSTWTWVCIVTLDKLRSRACAMLVPWRVRRCARARTSTSGPPRQSLYNLRDRLIQFCMWKWKPKVQREFAVLDAVRDYKGA